MLFVSISSNNFLPRFRVLYDSIRRFHPTTQVVLWKAGEYPVAANGLVTVQLPDAGHSIAAHRAKVLKHALTLDTHVIFQGADCEWFGSADEAVALLDKYDIVLVPHHCREVGVRREAEVFRTGLCNSDFVLAKRTDNTIAALSWLDRRLTSDCRVAVDKGFFNEQSWFNLMVGMFPNIGIWHTMTHNVAFWNVRSYNLKKTDQNQWITDGGPLKLYHFSSFDIRNPGRMSTSGAELPDGYGPVASGHLLEFHKQYANRVLTATRGLRLAWPN